MNNFEYQRNTKLIFGSEQLHKLTTEIKKNTNKKILLTYGSGSIKSSGLYDLVIKELNDNNIEFLELSGIKPNPEVSSARIGANLIKENNIDFILAVGGGSVLDNSKHMAIASKSDLDVWELLNNPQETLKLTNLPKIGAIITLAATGSEMNAGGVLTNPEVNEKRAMSHPECVPTFTFEDPTQLFTLPIVQRRAGASDTCSHLLEIYFGTRTDDQISDRLIEAILKNVINHYEDYINNNTYSTHANIFLSATLALNGITTLGKASQDWLTHAIEHEISAYTDLTHGIGLAIVHPVVLRLYYNFSKENNIDLIKFINLGKNVFLLNGSDEEIASQTITLLEELFYKISNVKTLKDVNITDFNALQSIEKLMAYNINSPYMNLEKDDFLDIFAKIKE